MNDYDIIGVPANHSVSDKDQIPLHYIITKSNKLYFGAVADRGFLIEAGMKLTKWIIKRRKNKFIMIIFYIRHGDPIYSPDSLTPLGERQAEAVSTKR